MGFSFGNVETPAGDFFDKKRANGHTLIVLPRVFEPGKKFPFGTADSVQADVVDLDDTDSKGQTAVFYDSDQTGVLLVKAFKDFLGQPLLIKFFKGNTAFLFENQADDPTAKAKADVFLSAHPEFLDGAGLKAHRDGKGSAANGNVAQQVPAQNPQGALADAVRQVPQKPVAPTPTAPAATQEQAALSALGAVMTATGGESTKTISASVFGSLASDAQSKLLAEGYSVV